LTALTQYTLVVYVGQRADYPLSGYLISLDAEGHVLTSASSPVPGAGTFSPVTVSFLSGASNPDLGGTLSIVLAATGYAQAEFDAISLDASGGRPRLNRGRGC
jgi:hypothetical protein